jgi:hypothetical protein
MRSYALFLVVTYLGVFSDASHADRATARLARDCCWGIKTVDTKRFGSVTRVCKMQLRGAMLANLPVSNRTFLAYLGSAVFTAHATVDRGRHVSKQMAGSYQQL